MSRMRRLLPGAIITSVLVAACAGIVVVGAQMLDEPVKPQKKVVQVHVFRPPPPPQVEEPPPPVEQQVKLPDPEPLADAPDVPNMPGDLGLDAEGVAGGDAFGLMGRKGGQALIGGEGRFRWYANHVKDEVLDYLSSHDDVRTSSYSVVLQVWIDADGRIGRCEVVGSTGDVHLDETLKFALADLAAFDEAPPTGMPQPVRLRIRSRA